MSGKSFDTARLNSVFNTEKGAKALLDTMETSCPKYISTGYKELDKALNGGLTASLYVLGAMPSLGKSTFLINMSERIASGETAVLYFSLEMPADHIARGTFCRCLFNAEKEENGLSKALEDPVSAAELLKENEIRKLHSNPDILKTAFERYTEIGENFYVIDRNYISGLNGKNSTIAASFVSSVVKDFKSAHNDKDIVVIMDYLQLLRPEENMKNPTERTVIDHSIAELWKIAHTVKIPVITISSINRASYSEPVTLASFKESGGIEFSADVVWGLQLNAESADFRDMQLVVLKNRYGSRDHNIGFRFYTNIGAYIENDELSPEVKAAAMSDSKKDTAEAEINTADIAKDSRTADVPEEKSEKNLTGYINNTKIANYLKKNRSNGGKHTLRIDDQKGKKAFYVTYKLTYKGADKSDENKSLSFMDCAVMDAALSHYNHSEFTACDLLKFMSGRDRITNSDTKRSIEEKIERSLLKLKNMEMIIDITDDFKMRAQNKQLNGQGDQVKDYQAKNELSCLLTGKSLASAAKALGVNDKPEERIILKGQLLPLSQGSEKGSFCIKDDKIPVLYEYSHKITHQIIPYSPELLNFGKMHISETALLERYYLVCRIEMLKYKLRTKPEEASSFKKIVLYDYQRYSGMIPMVTALAYDGSYRNYIKSDDFKRIKKNIINETTRSLEYLKEQDYIESYTVGSDSIEIRVRNVRQA